MYLEICKIFACGGQKFPPKIFIDEYLGNFQVLPTMHVCVQNRIINILALTLRRGDEAEGKAVSAVGCTIGLKSPEFRGERA